MKRLEGAPDAFRRYVVSLHSGYRIDSDHMDAWANGYSRFRAEEDYWGDLRVECMGVCEEMMREGWLVRADPPSRFPLDDYIRTAKGAKPRD